MTNGSTTWRYTYDANGMRTSRSNGSATYSYVYNGSQLTQMTKGSDTLYFTYGAVGPTTVTWNGTTYYYALNAQGDVVGIFDGSGNCVVTYNWDNAWGYNPEPESSMADTLGTLNPLRYRSYVYDDETGLYYLCTRYYDPEICRFINADAYTATGQGLLGNNMFAYCRNSPVTRVDTQGTFDKEAFDIDGDPTGDEKDVITSASTGAVGVSIQYTETSGIKVIASSSGTSMAIAGAPAGEKTEIHHIVEQCQIRKTGFSAVDIQGYSNKIELPYSVHRKISGFYSSKQNGFGGLRVRDWLAGQSFAKQYQFGIRVIEKMWMEIFGE